MRKEKKLESNNIVAALKYSSSLLLYITCDYKKARYRKDRYNCIKMRIRQGESNENHDILC